MTPVATPWALTAADLERRRGLRRMRVVATSLLGFAALVYVLTLHQEGAWGYVNATAEAGMVGALADWFAVSALFRHPLGLPIPHTALVPKRKDFLAVSLEDFVTGHFLTGDAVRERYLSADTTARLGRWLQDERHSTRVVQEVVTITERALGRIEDSDVRYLVEHSLLPRLVNEPFSPVAGALLQETVVDGVHHHLVDLVVVELHDWLIDNPEKFVAVLAERAPTWAPTWLNDIVTDRLHLEAVRWVQAIRDDRGHRVRVTVDDLLRDLASNLQEDPATMARAEQLKERALTHPQTIHAAVAVWEILRRALTRALADPDGLLRQRMASELVHLGARMQDDELLRRIIDERVGDSIAYLVQTYGTELATVISQVISGWDGKEAAERIELHVGRDLQFIRINGTIVGGLAGLIIHTLAQLAR
ncbi:MAG TPA: DUF445 domain-containing protein [Dermatophilaceae bacterium]|nr:DUF445 domain-containing protein [Dermatophilaceae bacterium]